MAYTPINWQTGQTITAEKLNKMDNGWSVEPSQILSETVTTAAVPPFGRVMGEFDYNTQITADTIIVTFDGTPYTCTAVIEGGTYYYGDADLISTPFLIWANADGNFLRTPSAGTYTVAISTSTVEISSDFSKARGYWGNSTPILDETVTTTAQPMGNHSGQFVYSEPITADTITVIFDGTTYTCKALVDGTDRSYGDPASMPFVISSTSEGNYLNTETAGTYTVAVSADSVETSSDFKAAVETSVDLSGILTPLMCFSTETTYDEMWDAIESGRILCFQVNTANATKMYIINRLGTSANLNPAFMPADSTVSASFVDGIFTVTNNL